MCAVFSCTSSVVAHFGLVPCRRFSWQAGRDSILLYSILLQAPGTEQDCERVIEHFKFLIASLLKNTHATPDIGFL